MNKKVNTHFLFDEKLMLHILGENNFPDIYSPFIELIKNSYDACKALGINDGYCKIRIDIIKQEISISDNGIGMDIIDLKQKWLVIGQSNKKNYDFYQGDKGIGRIAIHKIANWVDMYTQKSNQNYGLKWHSNWEKSNYETILPLADCGTKFILKDLKQVWTKKEIDKLKKVLKTLTFQVHNFSIFLNDEIIENDLDEEIKEELFEYIIRFQYNSYRKKLFIKVVENEFNSKILKKIVPDYNDSKIYVDQISLEKIIDDYNKSHKNSDKVEYYPQNDCGSFSGILLFRRGKTNEFQSERFHYINKNKFIDSENGIMIYRDGFIVRPFGISRKNDFFDISGRARRSPATQTKEDGKWRVRLNNITGVINISKKNNPSIIDQSNRNGFEENNSLEYFRIIVDSAIDFFERKRQNLTVKIDQFNKKEEIQQNTSFNDVVLELQQRLDKKKVTNITREEVQILSNQKEIYEENILNNNYDIRRMIYYTTQGLLTLSMYHEIKNNCDFIENFKYSIIDGLNKIGEKENLEKKFESVDNSDNLFYLIDVMQRINDNNASYSRKILKEEVSETFEKYITISEVEKVLIDIKKNWENKIFGINITIKLNCINETARVKMTKSDLFSIIDNLILNTTQSNFNVKKYKIIINIIQEDEKIIVLYENSGKSLDEQFQENPNKIFEYGVKSSSKKSGHGIGMWILKKTIDINQGDCVISKIRNGFGVDIFIPIINKE